MENESGVKREYRVGFHSIPSMEIIHMHVISTDFNSICLKNKTHWNSFTTDFFIEADDFLELLETNGRVSVSEIPEFPS